MSKHYSREQAEKAPSQRNYGKHLQVPQDCIDVWRVNVINRRGQAIIDSNWMDRDACMARADGIFPFTKLPPRDPRHLEFVYVEHKAATRIGERWHIVNIPSFQFGVLANGQARQPAPQDQTHEEWVAAYDKGASHGSHHACSARA